MKLILSVVALIALVGTGARAQDVLPSDLPSSSTSRATTLGTAQRHFYNGNYEAAAALTLELCAADAEDLAACELRTSALLFQVKRALGQSPDKEKARTLCTVCPDLIAAFVAETTRSRATALTRLEKSADDEETLFLLGKLDLNYVWLQLGTLGRKTGWREYWEARESLDKVLARNPHHLRARVARAWIDYIVDTQMPRGTKWLLGGGNKKRGLLVVKEAAAVPEADAFAAAEADFALWDMQVRERDLAAAVVTARELAVAFPANRELTRFLEANAPVPAR